MVQIWPKKHLTVNPSPLVSMFQEAGGGNIFLAHFGLLGSNSASFKCHSLDQNL